MRVLKKKLPVGIDDFKILQEENYYFVDKSLFIKEIIDEGAQVILLPRPRRFGKTLNLSMLKYYFEKNDDDYDYLFKNLKINKEREEYLKEQGKYPVINLTFKDIKENSWSQAEIKLKRMVAREFKRHKYLLQSDILDQYDKEFFRNILSLDAENAFYEEALKDLSAYLASYHQEKVIILIDEYDQPIQAAFYNNYYQKMINFMRNFLSAGLKNNLSLKKGVLTGILRVAKESIFSGLNNLVVSTILDNEYSQYFGLLEEELKDIFEYYELELKYEDLKSWYNGYYFGENIIYNPWSIINCIRRRGEVEPYWANTSSNDIIQDLIINSEGEIKKDLEILLNGDSITKKIDKNIIFSEITKKGNLIWSFLLLSGYLTASKKNRKDMYLYCDLKIPNKEIKYIYENIISQWFEEKINSQKLRILLKSLVEADIKTFAEIFREFVLNSMSTFDTGGRDPEKVYHAFVLGLLLNLKDSYQIKSNRESGYGRYDILIIPKDKSKKGIIIEFKKINSPNESSLEEAAIGALKQIKDKKYSQELFALGVNKTIELGIVFSGKEVLVKKVE